MLLFNLLCVSAFAAADSSYTQKVVYLLIDNSGSMTWNVNGQKKGMNVSRWNSAIYALESFVSLLNENDKIVVRSVGETGKTISFSANALTQEVLNKFLQLCQDDKEPGSGTYFKSVKELYGEMAANENKASSAEQELWFVIMTDGQFTEYTNGHDASLRPDEIYDYLKNTVTAQPIGGKVPQVLYLTICGNSYMSIDPFIEEDQSRGESVRIRTFSTPTVRGIIQTMEEISDYISGRIRYSSADYTLNGSTITFKTEIPMRDVVVLVQSESQKTGDISLPGFTQTRKADIVSPAKNLRAYVRQFQKSEGNIQPGTYTVNLSRIPERDDVITLLFQPALVVRNTYTVTDRYGNSYDLKAEELANSRDIFAGSTIVTHVHVYEAGSSGKEYPISSLPGRNAAVTVTSVSPDKKEKTLQKLSGQSYDYSCTVEMPGANALRTTVKLPKYNNMELRREDNFQVRSTDEDPLYPITGASALSQNVTVTQLTMARDGVRVSFRLNALDGKKIGSLESYIKNNVIAASASDPNGASVPVVFDYSSADPTLLVAALPAISGAAAGDYQVVLNLANGRISAACKIRVTASELSLRADGGEQITRSRLQLRNQAASIPFALYDNGAAVNGVNQVKVSVSPASKAFAWSGGVLTVREDGKLAAGTYTLSAENYCGLPVNCDTAVTITEGEDEIAVQGLDKTLSQVDMYEKGAEASFAITYQGRALTAQEIDTLIRAGKLTVSAADGKIKLGALRASEGQARCAIESAWLSPGQYPVTLTVKGNAGAELSRADSGITVQKSSFEAEADPSAVAYDAFRAGSAQVRLTALREKGSSVSLDLGKYQAALSGSAGVWNGKDRTFTLNGTGSTREPIPLDYLVMGETEGRLFITVIDPLASVSVRSADTARTSQWKLLYGPEETILRYTLMDHAVGQALSLDKARELIGEFTVESTGALNTAALSLTAEQGGVSLKIKPQGYEAYRQIPTGEFTFVLKRGEEEFGHAVLRVEESDVRAKNDSPPAQWSAFKNSGSLQLTLSLWDGGEPLSAQVYSLTSGAALPSGQSQTLTPVYAGDTAGFTVSYPKDFAQGDTLILKPAAMGEALPEIPVQLENASYEVRITPEGGAQMSQIELPQGKRLAVQVLEDGKPIVPPSGSLSVSGSVLSVTPAGTDGNGETSFYMVSSDDVILTPGDYPITVSYTSALGAAWPGTCVLTVTDSMYQVSAKTPELTIEARDITSQGCRVQFIVTHSGGQSVPRDQILSLFSSLPEYAEGTEEVLLAWSAPEDGVLCCDVTTTQSMHDFETGREYIVSCTLKNGAGAQTTLAVKKVYYDVKASDQNDGLVHTRLHETDQSSVYFYVVYTDENGDEQAPVPADILQGWIGNGRFTFTYEYRPQDGFWQQLSNWFRFGRDRLRLRLETTGKDGEIKASAQGVWNYTGLWGLEGYYHNVGDRWFVPVGTVEASVTLADSSASAVFRIIRDEPLKEWGLYFALPIYIVLSILRALFKKKFPWRRLQAAALAPAITDRRVLTYDYPSAKGFFFRKVLGFFLWPVVLPVNIFLHITTRDHRDIWTEKNIMVGSIQVRCKAAGRIPFRHEDIEIILSPEINYYQTQQKTLEDGSLQTRFRRRDLLFTSYGEESAGGDPHIITLSYRDEELFLKEGDQSPAYGILMKSKI